MRFLATLLSAAALSLPASAALAGSIEIGPISIGMIGKERTSTVTVRNPGTDAVNLQIRTVDWTQSNGEDVYTPSQTLVASPPFFTLAPGKAQTIRLVVTGPPAPTTTERAWRLIVDELPQQRGAGAGIQVPVRALVPVFLAPTLQARPKLAWSAARAEGGAVKLTVSNSGPVHERLTGMTLTAGKAKVGGNDPLYGYVLSGATRSWTVKGPVAAGALNATADGAYGPVKTSLRLD